MQIEIQTIFNDHVLRLRTETDTRDSYSKQAVPARNSKTDRVSCIISLGTGTADMTRWCKIKMGYMMIILRDQSGLYTIRAVIKHIVGAPL